MIANGVVLDAWPPLVWSKCWDLGPLICPGRFVASFVSNEALADSRERIANAFDAGRSSQTTYHLDTSARRIWFQTSFSPLHNRAGNIVAAVVSVRDVTEQNRIVNALQVSEERYRSLFDRVPVGLYRSTADGRLLDANPILVRMFGFDSREECWPVQPPDSTPTRKTGSGCASIWNATTWLWVSKSRGRRRDGSTIWIKLNTRAVDAPDGNTRYFEGSVEDITQRRTAEEALRDSELRYRTLAESAPDSIFIIGADDRVRYVNTFGAALLRRQPEDLIGRSRAELFPPREGNRQAEACVGCSNPASPWPQLSKHSFQTGPCGWQRN